MRAIEPWTSKAPSTSLFSFAFPLFLSSHIFYFVCSLSLTIAYFFVLFVCSPFHSSFCVTSLSYSSCSSFFFFILFLLLHASAVHYWICIAPSFSTYFISKRYFSYYLCVSVRLPVAFLSNESRNIREPKIKAIYQTASESTRLRPLKLGCETICIHKLQITTKVTWLTY